MKNEPLSNWLAETKTRKIDLARAIGVTPGRVTQICNGDTPSLEVAGKIEDFTRRAVRMSDFRPAPAPVGDAA